jgi:hypothetical protein
VTHMLREPPRVTHYHAARTPLPPAPR